MKKIALISLTALLGACTAFPLSSSFSGTYQGTLTCADCEKIEAELVLNSDDSYQYNTVYHFKNKEAQMFNESGKFRRDSNNSDLIYLQNSVNLPLKVSKEYVEFCDGTGKPVQGNANYKLYRKAATN